MITTKLLVGLLTIAGMLGCSSSTTKSDQQMQPAQKTVTHVFFKSQKIHVWSHLPIAESSGGEKSRDGALNVAGDGWVKYEKGPRVESAGSKLRFNQDVIAVTALNMVVNQTNFVMGAFIRTFE
jgi:hypothetical protein